MMKMVGRVYGGYLETYIRDEKVHLRNTSTAELTKFYEARQHLKKPVGGFVVVVGDVWCCCSVVWLGMCGVVDDVLCGCSVE